MTDSQDNNETKRLPWVGIVVVLLMLYVLSIGPFWRLCLQGYIPFPVAASIWETAYLPIQSLVLTRHFGDAIRWYVDQWSPSGAILIFGPSTPGLLYLY